MTARRALCFLGIHRWIQASSWRHNRRFDIGIGAEMGATCEVHCERCARRGMRYQAYDFSYGYLDPKHFRSSAGQEPDIWRGGPASRAYRTAMI